MAFKSLHSGGEADVRSYVRLFRFDVVAWEDARAVPDRAVPPLAVLLAHQDHVALSKRQIAHFGRLVPVQRHVLCKIDGEGKHTQLGDRTPKPPRFKEEDQRPSEPDVTSEEGFVPSS